MSMIQDKLRFLTEDKVKELAHKHGTPFFVYSRKELLRAAEEVTNFASLMPYGCTIRYAVKANEHPDILRLFDSHGLSFDASSAYEAENLVGLGIDPAKVLLTSQQLPQDPKETIIDGMQFTATSLHQLEVFCEMFPGRELGVRINPGIGKGINNRLTTGGVGAGFGIWHEYIPEVLKAVEQAGNTLNRLHIHIGTGYDPDVWTDTVKTCLGIARMLPSVTILDIGGGFKTAYMPDDKEADMAAIGRKIAALVEDFAQDTGRKLRIEIEPGRFMVAHAGSLISEIIDLTDTGSEGYKFIRINSGMTEILRPAMYGAQHQLLVVGKDVRPGEAEDYVVIGHCCESGDCLTVKKDDPERLEPRKLQKPQIGDFLVIESAGAYCASMAAAGYNAFPRAKEVLVD